MNNVRTGLQNLLHNPQQHSLYAIDKFWFNLQKIDNWFLIVPLTVVQREDYSDIEKRVINYKRAMTDLDKEELLNRIKIHKDQENEKKRYQEIISKINR